MVTVALACTGVREYGIYAGTFGDGLIPPSPSVTVSPPPLLGVVPVEVEGEIDLVYLTILSVVTLESRSQLFLLMRLT